LSVTPGHTLFIETGSLQREDSLDTTLRNIAQGDPRVYENFKKRTDSGNYSILSLPFNDSDFQRAYQYWESTGNTVVNMDCSDSTSPSALQFIIEQTSPEFALERTYEYVRHACSSLDILPVILQKIYPQQIFPAFTPEFIQQQCDKLSLIYSDKLAGAKRHLGMMKESNRVREEYMRNVLGRQLKEDDIVLAHPDHITAVIQPDQIMNG
jgi:hypothetical protein